MMLVMVVSPSQLFASGEAFKKDTTATYNGYDIFLPTLSAKKRFQTIDFVLTAPFRDKKYMSI